MTSILDTNPVGEIIPRSDLRPVTRAMVSA